MISQSSTIKEVQPVSSLLQLSQRLQEGLREGRRLALATVISRTGSGPREAGAAMIIDGAGNTLGTVGGGLVEARTLDLALEVLREGRSACLAMTLTSPQAAAGGMICGGKMEVLVEFMDGASASELALLEKLLVTAAQGPCLLVRSLRMGDGLEVKNRSDEARSRVQTGWGLLAGDFFEAGSLDISGFDPERLKKEPPEEPLLMEGGPVRYFIQPLGAPKEVLIVGAGHVGQALAALCPFVGFRTVVIDDRGDFANQDRFPKADDIRVQASLEDPFQGLAVTGDSYIVIVTRGHAWDRAVLARALRTGAGYIGMIASKTKRDLTYKGLLGEGFTPEDIGRVHSPIGLMIGAKTPEEIAVSIIAELIAVRAGKV